MIPKKKYAIFIAKKLNKLNIRKIKGAQVRPCKSSGYMRKIRVYT
jgi:hypothetical protein